MTYQAGNTKRLFFDIETAANPENLALMPEPKAPGNIKDPVKIAAAIAEKKQELIDMAALDPDYGKVLSIGYSIVGTIEVVMVGDVKEKLFIRHDKETDTDIWETSYTTENDLLEMFWRTFSRGSW